MLTPDKPPLWKAKVLERDLLRTAPSLWQGHLNMGWSYFFPGSPDDPKEASGVQLVGRVPALHFPVPKWQTDSEDS